MDKKYIRIISLFKKGSFVRNTFTLMIGTIISQLLVFLSSPIITRIFKPEALGISASYAALITIIGGFITWKYELGLLIPKSSKIALSMLHLGVSLSVISCTIVFFVIIYGHKIIANLMGIAGYERVLYLLPLSLLLSALLLLLANWNIRNKKFSLVGFSRASQSGGAVLSEIILGLFLTNNVWGLLISQLIGQAIGTIVLLIRQLKIIYFKVNGLYLQRLKRIAYKYRAFPQYMSIAGIVNNLATYAPIFILGSYFSSSVVGYYALAQRAIQAPVSIIGGSVADVFFKEASDLAEQPKRLHQQSIRVAVTLLALGSIPVIILIFFGPLLFEFVFSSEWRISGKFAQIMSIYLLFQFVFSPLSNLFNVLERQRLYQIWEWIRLFLVVTGTLLGTRLNTPIGVVICYSISMSLSYLILGILVFKIIKNHDKHVQ